MERLRLSALGSRLICAPSRRSCALSPECVWHLVPQGAWSFCEQPGLSLLRDSCAPHHHRASYEFLFGRSVRYRLRFGKACPRRKPASCASQVDEPASTDLELRYLMRRALQPHRDGAGSRTYTHEIFVFLQTHATQMHRACACAGVLIMTLFALLSRCSEMQTPSIEATGQ